MTIMNSTSSSYLSVFDLDHTLLKVNSSFCFGTYLYREKYFSSLSLFYCLLYYARHKFLRMSINNLHHKTFKLLFQGRSLAELNCHVQVFLQQKLKDLFYPPALAALCKAQELGYYTALVSSSPDFLVKPIADYLQMTYWNATCYGPNEQGNLQSILSIMEGQDKAVYVQKLSQQLEIPLSSLTVYSDSYLDLPVLKIAGNAIGVRPDSRLRKFCIKKGWEII